SVLSSIALAMGSGFNYQFKYLYHSLTCLDFIKKYLLFCIHVSRDGDLIKLVNYYELRCKLE
ncbi:hypothetical protein, partial [Klebsiella variicola]|uniref:hypothetical protein n=1 Tax=Klebsiella variicola TaxID=244366 RepID=UPI0019549F3C